MKIVQLIRDKEIIQKFKNELLKNGTRDYFMFTMGVNVGLRISYMLSLKVENVRDKSHITITEQKTRKSKRFLINPMLREDINRYIASII